MESTPVYRDGLFWFLAIITVVIVLLQNKLMGSLKDGWYDSLIKPEWIPPGYFFSIMWALIYLLLVWSTTVGFRHAESQTTQVLIIGGFLLNLGLNYMWTRTFFYQKNLTAAVWVLIVLLIETIGLAYLVYQSNQMAGYAFGVYIVWLLVALYYNLSIATKN